MKGPNRQDRASEVVTAEVIADFQRDGAVPLRGLFDAADLEILEAGIRQNLAAPSPRANIASDPDDPGQFFEDFCNWTQISGYETFIRRSPAAGAAGRLMGSGEVRFYHDHLLVKAAGTRQVTPWHQDQPYYNIEGNQALSLWIPIDPVPRVSTLEFVAGSHLGPWRMPRSFRNQQAKWFPPGALAEMPDIEADPDAYRVIGWSLRPGDAVAFHNLTLHAAAGVGPGRPRRVFSARFLGDDITHAPRPWATSPDFLGLEDELPAGAPMHHPLFPVLWQRGD